MLKIKTYPDDTRTRDERESCFPVHGERNEKRADGGERA